MHLHICYHISLEGRGVFEVCMRQKRETSKG